MRNRQLNPRGSAALVEALEVRRLLATVSVNVNQTIRSINANLLGLNTAPWDSNLGDTSTATLVSAMGTTAVRMGGGSNVDLNLHFNVYDPNNNVETLAQEAVFTAAHGNTGVLTANYGTGSPQEAAAELAYLNGSTADTTTIGVGEQWDTSSNSWVSVDWKTVGYWASLRAAKQLRGNDDGLNFLRLGGSVSGEVAPVNLVTHPSAFGIHYWEIGNELYGDWETDEHGIGGDTLTMPVGKISAAHDPTTYISFAKQFATLAATISPGISIGLDSAGPDVSGDYASYTNWIKNVLTQANSTHQNLAIGFISDHLYDQEPGDENDTTLLSAPTKQYTPAQVFPDNWPQRAAAYRADINTYYGTTAGAGIELMATEFNSVSYNPGKQISSLVNGVFVADSLGELMQTEYNGAFIWDLHNYFDTAQNNSSGLYGWRNGGDYGVLGSNQVTSGSQLESKLNEPFPNYFAEQLASKIIQTGGTVISATSNDANLDVFAVKEPNNNIDLLVINKSQAGLNPDGTGAPQNIAANFAINGFVPNASAQSWQYGSTEDNAQKNSAAGAASLTNSSLTLSVNGSNFSVNFPSLSMTVIALTPAAPKATGMSFPYATASNQVQFTFDQDMLSSSFAPADLTLTNTDGRALPTVQSVQYVSATKTATFTIAAPVDSNYAAKLLSGSVSSSYRTPTSADYSFNFFSLIADANHDRVVNTLDFNALATNYGKAGTFAQGDFNYSGTVNSSDFDLLAASFGTTLSAPEPVVALLDSQPRADLFSGQSISESFNVLS